MANTVIGASVEVEFSSVGNMRKALKEANQELIRMQAQFGDASKEALAAAEKVGALKGQIKDAAETANLFDPSKKFQAFVDLGANIASGFTAVQGAMALVGVEGEELQKTMVKLQGAMALAQGLGQLKEFGESWGRMTGFISKATKNLSGFQKVLLGTGVGILVAIVAAWEDISKAIGLASNESENFKEVQEKSNQALADAKTNILEVNAAFKSYKDNIISKEETLKIYNETLGDSLGKTDDIFVAEQRLISNTGNYLKSVELKAKSQAAFAKSAELSVQLESDLAKGARDAGITVEQYKKNIEDLGLNVLKDAQKEIDDLNAIATQAFEDSAKLTQEIGAETLNKQYDDNKKANDKKLKDNEDFEKKSQDLKLKALELQKEITNDLNKFNLSAQEKELYDLKNKYNEQKKMLEEGGQDAASLTKLYENQRQEIIGKYADEEKKKREEVENELNKIKEEIQLLGIRNIREKEKAELALGYADQLIEIEKNENYNAEQKAQFRAALLTKQKIEEDALNEKFRQEDLQKESARLLSDSSIQTTAFEDRLKLIQDRKALENQIIFASEEEKANFIKQNEEATTKVIADQYNARVQLAKSVGDALSALTDIVGKETAAGKALAIAQATINTFLGITEVWKSKAVLPEPFNTATKVAATITTAAGGFAAVRNIAKTKVPGGGGPPPPPTPPPLQTAAPVTPALSPAVQGQALNANAINNLGNTALRAYVMNSDIQNNDQRNAYLQRNARIG